MKDLKVTTIQSNLTWENPATNLNNFESLIDSITEQTDLIILPEMFTTGFTMDPKPVAEKMDGPTMQWMANHAAKQNAVITGSIIIEASGKFYNRLVWMRPDGTYDTYSKRHLFTLAGEHKKYTKGTERKIIELEGWKICPLICYDLRFPVWSRNNEAYDLLLYVANWPDKRIKAWSTLLAGRAVENQCYTIGVNRVGTDVTGLNYDGTSSVINFDGELIYTIKNEVDIRTTTLNYEALHQFREKLAFLDDRDHFVIEM